MYLMKQTKKPEISIFLTLNNHWKLKNVSVKFNWNWSHIRSHPFLIKTKEDKEIWNSKDTEIIYNSFSNKIRIEIFSNHLHNSFPIKGYTEIFC